MPMAAIIRVLPYRAQSTMLPIDRKPYVTAKDDTVSYQAHSSLKMSSPDRTFTERSATAISRPLATWFYFYHTKPRAGLLTSVASQAPRAVRLNASISTSISCVTRTARVRPLIDLRIWITAASAGANADNDGYGAGNACRCILEGLDSQKNCLAT